MAMFSVGEFARLAQVPVKTLRYYDEIGLFAPTDVDPATGYRRYAATQLALLNRILALRALGFRLDDIRRLVSEPVSTAELRGMFLLRRAQVEHDLAQAKSQIIEIESRLRQLEKENHAVPDVAFLTKIVPAVPFVGAREVVHDQRSMRDRCIALDEQARRAIRRLRLSIDGPCCALYYPCEEAIDVEMGYPVRAVDLDPDDPAVHILAPTEVAYAVYTGSYDDFSAVAQLHVALRTWVESRGTTSTAPSRELYIQLPTDTTEGVMELQYPLRQDPRTEMLTP